MATQYQELSKIYYKAGSHGNSALEKTYQERFNAESTFRTGIVTGGHELFLAVPHELIILTEHILRKERRVSNALRRLPPIARSSLIRSLVMDEIVCTNEIEGIHSTRKQINDVLESIDQDGRNRSNDFKRFRELARLYLQLSDESHEDPRTPADIRSIYDSVMDGELEEKDRPDGTLFRKESVEIIGSGTKAIHTGVNPESAIVDYLEKNIELVHSEYMPELYSAAIFHYVFEYVHPFYDGNGRTGRYLLALHLSKVLSVPTALSLSRVIAEDKGAYYRGFKSVENHFNRSDATPFVLMTMQFVERAQDDMIDKLENDSRNLDKARESLARYERETPDSNEKECNLLYQMAQVKLFGMFDAVSVHEISKHLGCSAQTARKHAASLEARGLIETASKRPLSFRLSERGNLLLFGTE